jgi:hypothetical protein
MVPVKRDAATGKFVCNPDFLFADNPEFLDNPSRGSRSSRRASTSRRTGRSRTAGRRRDSRGRSVKSGRRSSTSRTSSRRSGRRHYDNPDFYGQAFLGNPDLFDNPEFSANPDVSWMSIGLGIGFAALTYTLIDMLDRYVATSGKTDAWYGPDAFARIYERPSGMRIAVQAVVAVLGIGGAIWYGRRDGSSPNVVGILAGIGGGAATHLTVQLLTTWLMPKMLKAGDGTTTDKTLGNRLYPEFQDGSQAQLHLLTDAEDQASATSNPTSNWISGTNMPAQGATPPGVIGIGTAGAQQNQGGFLGRQREAPQLPAPQPRFWPRVAEEPRAGVGVAGCTSCGSVKPIGPQRPLQAPQAQNGQVGTARCGCKACRDRDEADRAAAAYQDAFGVGAHDYRGGGYPMAWDVGHGAGCMCGSCQSKRGTARSEIRSGAQPCVTEERQGAPRDARKVVMPDVEHHVVPNAPPPVQVQQGQVRIVVHETPEAPIEMQPCPASQPAAPPPMPPAPAVAMPPAAVPAPGGAIPQVPPGVRGTDRRPTIADLRPKLADLRTSSRGRYASN